MAGAPSGADPGRPERVVRRLDIVGVGNPLSVLLASLLLTGLVRVIFRGDAGWGLAAGLGVLVAALIMTRPDGIVFFAAYPAALIAAVLMRWSRRPSHRDHPNLPVCVGSFAVLYGDFLLFRVAVLIILLPSDGMGEYRFGMNSALFVYLCGGKVGWELLAGLRVTSRARSCRRRWLLARIVQDRNAH